MNAELIARLRSDLRAAGYDAAAVRALLGAEADEARQRGVLEPARRALDARGPSVLGGLIRLLLLGEPLPEGDVDAALPELRGSGSLALGLTRRDGDRYRAALSLNPVEIADPQADEPVRWWILSDLDDQLRRGAARPDHVMGVGGATRSLIAQLPAGERASSLDLGTGCGVVALHLALRRGPVGVVVATDISARALRLARANAELNGVAGIDFRRGDLFEPVTGERFELIASNPPFVVTPRREGREPIYEYRDGGLVGDALAARVIREGSSHLIVGGTLVCLANWESPWGADGLDRVREWAAGAAAPTACWAIERDRISPERYAETWARDGGARPGDPEFDALLREWLDDFAARRVVALGLGSVRLRRLAPGSAPLFHGERANGAFSQHPGAHLEAAFTAAVATSALPDDEVLARRWLLDPSVGEIREHRPGEEAPRAIALTGEAGITRRVSADPLLAAALGACDGDLTLRQIADALATLLEVDAEAAGEALVAGVRELVWLGMLAPAGR